MAPPSIVFVAGYWEGTAPYERVRQGLQAAGCADVHVVALSSTGTTYPGSPTMADDVRAIHDRLEAVVGEATDVLLVLHSVSGILGSDGMRGLGAGHRRDRGLRGGVRAIVFLAAAVAPEGFEHGPRPFMKIEDDRILPLDPVPLMLNDLGADEAAMWAARFQPQPTHWDGTVTYCGWRDVPSWYVVCARDKLLPEALQRQFAGMAGCERIEVLEAGHMPQLSVPDEVVAIVTRAAEELGRTA